MTADAQTPTDDAAKTQSFEADVSRLLHLMVHSVYSDRDIFVRELVSNAADACEKLRYEAIARPELIESGGPFAITISLNPEAKTLTVADNGVGMSTRGPDRGTRHHRPIRHQGLPRQACDRGREQGGCRAHWAVRHRLLFVLHGRRRGGGRHPPGGDERRLALVVRRPGLVHHRAARARSRRRRAAPASCFTSTTPAMNFPPPMASNASCASIRARSRCRSTSSTRPAACRGGSPTGRRSGPSRSPT